MSLMPCSARFLPVCVAAVLVLAGCQPDENTTADNAPVTADVVATVDGRALTATDLDAQIQAMAARGHAVDRSGALDELVDLMLLAQAAEAQQLHQQPEVAAEMRRQRAMLLANHLIRAELHDLDIDEEMLRARYEAALGDDDGRREFHARHILLEDRESAETLIRQLDEGAEFAELAREHSIDPLAERGGDLDWFRADDMVPAFADGVRALEVGAHSTEPVETRFGWHIILLEGVRDAERAPFEDVRDELRNRMISEHMEAFLDALRADADVRIEME